MSTGKLFFMLHSIPPITSMTSITPFKSKGFSRFWNQRYWTSHTRQHVVNFGNVKLKLLPHVVSRVHKDLSSFRSNLWLYVINMLDYIDASNFSNDDDIDGLYWWLRESDMVTRQIVPVPRSDVSFKHFSLEWNLLLLSVFKILLVNFY